MKGKSKEKKEYIIATLKKMMTMDTFFFFVFGPKNDTFLSRLNTTIYSSTSVLHFAVQET